MLRYALSPRWIPGHLLALGVFLACLRLGWWQWEGRTSVQNTFYAAQWVFFGAVALWFWWRYLKDERRADAEWDAEQQALAAAGEADPG